MFTPRIVLNAFHGEHDRARGERAILRLLRALADINADYLREFPRTPRLYDAGVRYKRQACTGDFCREDWLDIPGAIAEGQSDCKVLCAWRLAELALDGANVAPHLTRLPAPAGKFLYHVRVYYPDTKIIECPSRILGMDEY